MRHCAFKSCTSFFAGTLLRYKGNLGEWYVLAARREGLTLNCDTADISAGFKLAYEDVSLEHPCFGGSHMSRYCPKQILALLRSACQRERTD